jgi:hypothetical protein
LTAQNRKKLTMLQAFKVNEDELKNYDTEESTKNEEAGSEEDDEFFLAISSSRKLQTGSCPEFYWYPIIPFSAALMSNSLIDSNNSRYKASFEMKDSLIKRRAKSVNDLSYSTIKSFENITHNNYVQMVNSMINGAISDVADPEYVEYVRRHIQGLFDNYTPVLIKSKSNEEMTINSPSRDKIVEIINQSIPKSYSFDLKLLEETKLNNDDNFDAMNFAKFGLGIEDSNEDTCHQHEEDKAITKIVETVLEELKIASSNYLENNINTELDNCSTSKESDELKECSKNETSFVRNENEATNNDSDLSISENIFEYVYSVNATHHVDDELIEAIESKTESNSEKFENPNEEITTNDKIDASNHSTKTQEEENLNENPDYIKEISFYLNSLIEKIIIEKEDEFTDNLQQDLSLKPESNELNASSSSEENISEILALSSKNLIENSLITKDSENKEHLNESYMKSEESVALCILNEILEARIVEEIITSKLDEIINTIVEESLVRHDNKDNQTEEDLENSTIENINCESTTSTLKLANQNDESVCLTHEENDKTESTLNFNSSSTDLDLAVETNAEADESISNKNILYPDAHNILDSIISKALEKLSSQEICSENESILEEKSNQSVIPTNDDHEENNQIIRDHVMQIIENVVLQSQIENLSNQDTLKEDKLLAKYDLFKNEYETQDTIENSNMLENNLISTKINMKNESNANSLHFLTEQNVEIGPTKNIIQLVNELPDVQQNNSSKFNSTNYILE